MVFFVMNYEPLLFEQGTLTGIRESCTTIPVLSEGVDWHIPLLHFLEASSTCMLDSETLSLVFLEA